MQSERATPALQAHFLGCVWDYAREIERILQVLTKILASSAELERATAPGRARILLCAAAPWPSSWPNAQNQKS